MMYGIVISLAALALLSMGAFHYTKYYFRPSGAQLESMEVKAITGSTVAERLRNKMDIDNAVITKITNVEQMQNKYGVIFKNAKNGYYLIETSEKILIYDFEHDEIVQEFAFQRIDLGEQNT